MAGSSTAMSAASAPMTGAAWLDDGGGHLLRRAGGGQHLGQLGQRLVAAGLAPDAIHQLGPLDGLPGDAGHGGQAVAQVGVEHDRVVPRHAERSDDGTLPVAQGQVGRSPEPDGQPGVDEVRVARPQGRLVGQQHRLTEPGHLGEGRVGVERGVRQQGLGHQLATARPG